MKKQCSWCKKLYNTLTGRWENSGAYLLPEYTCIMCPECRRNMDNAIQVTGKKRSKF